MTLRDLINEARALLETGKAHSPFKSCGKIGTGPRGGSNTATDEWECEKAAPYIQLCTNKRTGEEKYVKINRAYKKGYNAQYKPWERQGRPGSDCPPGERE